MEKWERTARNLALGAVVVLAALYSFREVHNEDLGWQIAAGRLILETGHVPRTDPFSLLSFGRPWIDAPWLAQVVLAWLHDRGGYVAIQMAVVLVIVGACLCAWAAAGVHGRPMVPLALLLAVMASYRRFEPRPDILTLVLPCALVLMLDRLSRPARSSRALLLAVCGLTILWANLHGSFILAPLITGAYLLGSLLDRSTSYRRRPILLALGVTVFSTFVNPRGMGLWALYSTYVHDVRARLSGSGGGAPAIKEWLPTFSRGAGPIMGETFWFYAILLGVCLVGSLGSARRFSAPRAAVLLLLTAFSVSAMRNVGPFAFFAAGMCVAPWTAGLLARLGTRWAKPASAVLSLIVLVAAGLGSFEVATNRYYVNLRMPMRTGPGAQASAYPRRAFDYVEAAGISGQAFHNYALGGAYIQRFAPGRLAFCDGRLGLLAPSEMTTYLTMMERPESLKAFSERYHITHIILSYQPEGARLLQWLERSGNWVRAFSDGAGVVYVPSKTPPPEVSLPPPEVHPLDALAKRVFRPLAGLQRSIPAWDMNLGCLAMAAGDEEAALAHYDNALAKLPRYEPVLETRVRLIEALTARSFSNPAWEQRLAEARRELARCR